MYEFLFANCKCYSTNMSIINTIVILCNEFSNFYDLRRQLQAFDKVFTYKKIQ